MAALTPVTLRRDGILLTVETLTPDLCRLLEECLSYTKRIQLHGMAIKRNHGSRIKLEPRSCYEYRGGPGTGFSRKLCTTAGYTSKICKLLLANGYQPELIDQYDMEHDKFKLQWDRMKHVNWRWGQRTVLKRIEQHPFGRIKCCPGYGKSFIIRALCQLWPDATFAVTTHSVDVLRQIYEELLPFLPKVGIVGGGDRSIGRRVTCFSGKSLHYCKKKFDVVLVDECHEFGTDDYLERLALPSLHHARRYGLSANQDDRTDMMDFELEGALGPLIVDIPYQQAVKHGCVVPIQVDWRDVVMDVDPCDPFYHRGDTMIERAGIWQNEVRNRQIAKDANSFGPNEQVLITVDVIEHAVFLKSLLPDFTLCYSENGMDATYRQWCVNEGLIRDDEPIMTTKRRMQLKHEFEVGRLKKVIANTVWKRGVDFRQLAVLIRADAKASRIADTQIPGRVSRIYDDKPVGLIIDYKDQFCHRFRQRAKLRKANYDSFGWTSTEPPPSKSRFARGQLL